MEPTKILSGATVLLVRDVEMAADYYRDKLGFRYSRLWGEPPCFCMAWRDEQCLMLSQVENHAHIRSLSDVAHIWDAYLWVDDADKLYAELEERGAILEHAPCVTDYGVKEFTVRDLDGYQLAFGEELDEPAISEEPATSEEEE
ncbi:MAG: VOC family protein [Thermoanaerobaculia bacterium]|nr:VOC family protein [Thermoanaerobaculia bacterium]